MTPGTGSIGPFWVQAGCDEGYSPDVTFTEQGVGMGMAYERHGSGEPLVLIHGIGHRRQAWLPILDLLTPHHEVFLIDLPGHGDSDPWPAGGEPREVIRQALHELLAETGIERPHLVGNSLGGLIALEAALDGHARTVTALSPAGFWRDQRDWAYIRSLFATMTSAAVGLAPFAPQLVRTSAGRALMYSWLSSHPGRIRPEAALGDLRNMLRARRTMAALFESAYAYAEGHPADTPVTIAWATKDRVLRPHQAAVARAQLPHAHHVWLNDCGHVPMSDHPHLVANVILAQTGALLSTQGSRAA